MSGEQEAIDTPPWPDAVVRSALGLPSSGEVRGEPKQFKGISTDTRAISPGALFVALVGERFDGHNYLAEARDRGARAAIVHRGTRPVTNLELLEVGDTLRAYGALARVRRRTLSGPVVAVSGTNGKTSTKEMLAALLRTRFNVHATRENNNNLVGVPLSILEAPAGVEALVIEAGANQPGEIARCREIIEPTIAVVTNVGAGHLEGFGSLAGVMAEKLSLLDGVELAVVGVNPPELGLGAVARARRLITAGLADADRVPERVTLDELGRATLFVDGESVTLPYPGHHLAENAMLAWVVGEALGLDKYAAAEALRRFTVPGGRSELQQVGAFTILNDCYNANPQSFRAAIATARTLRGSRRLVFVAGTMRELGAEAPRLHAEVAQALVALDPDLLAAVGDFVPALEPHARALGDRLVTAPDAPTLGPLLASRLRGNEIVVLKGSRGVALERILPALSTPPTHPLE